MRDKLLTLKLGTQERRADTRRKIIDGAHIQTEALTNPEIAALLDRLRRAKVVSDDDCRLFGLAPLSEIEKAARGIVNGRATRKNAAADNSAVASAALFDNSADATAPLIENRETEDA